MLVTGIAAASFVSNGSGIVAVARKGLAADATFLLAVRIGIGRFENFINNRIHN